MTTNISPKQAEEMLKAGDAILVDVRDNDMYQAEHIIYAASVPVEQLNQQQLQALTEQPKKVIFQCMRGIKSQQASNLAKDLGDRVYNMEGGLVAWKEAGLPTLLGTNTNGPKMSLVRQMQITLGIVLLVIFLIPFLTGLLGFLLYLIPVIGIVLIAAGFVGCCPLMKILGQMPWNK